MQECKHPYDKIDWEPFPKAPDEFYVFKCTECGQTISIVNRIKEIKEGD